MLLLLSESLQEGTISLAKTITPVKGKPVTRFAVLTVIILTHHTKSVFGHQLLESNENARACKRFTLRGENTNDFTQNVTNFVKKNPPY